MAHLQQYVCTGTWHTRQNIYSTEIRTPPSHPPPIPPCIHLEKGQLRIFGKRVALVRENVEGDWTNFLLSNSKDSYWHDSKQHVHQCATHCDAL